MGQNQTWGHRWVTKKAAPFKSMISGHGLVAIDAIAKGEIICVYGGIIVPKKDIQRYTHDISHLGIQISENFFLCPVSDDDGQKYGALNHSCDPTCGFKDSVTAIAIRDVNKGEELTLDYAFLDSARFNFECKCGSKNCRRKVTPDDWKLMHLHEKYFDYFLPYLKEKIAALDHINHKTQH